MNNKPKQPNLVSIATIPFKAYAVYEDEDGEWKSPIVGIGVFESHNGLRVAEPLTLGTGGIIDRVPIEQDNLQKK